MSNPLAGLITPPSGPKPWRLRDGTITTTTPLTVLIDGDDDPVTPTKAPLIATPTIGDRVLLVFAGKELILMGRYGG